MIVTEVAVDPHVSGKLAPDHKTSANFWHQLGASAS